MCFSVASEARGVVDGVTVLAHTGALIQCPAKKERRGFHTSGCVQMTRGFI